MRRLKDGRAITFTRPDKPTTTPEAWTRALIWALYRKTPEEFYKDMEREAKAADRGNIGGD